MLWRSCGKQELFVDGDGKRRKVSHHRETCGWEVRDVRAGSWGLVEVLRLYSVCVRTAPPHARPRRNTNSNDLQGPTPPCIFSPQSFQSFCSAGLPQRYSLSQSLSFLIAPRARHHWELIASRLETGIRIPSVFNTCRSARQDSGTRSISETKPAGFEMLVTTSAALLHCRP